MTPPVIRVGWQTDQSANTKDLTFSLNPAHYRANPRVTPWTATNLLNGVLDTGFAGTTYLKTPYFPSSTGYNDRAQTGAVLAAATDFDT